MIYHYSIAEALDDKIIKSVVVYEPEVKLVELTYTNKETGEKRKVWEIKMEHPKRLWKNCKKSLNKNY